MGHQARCKLSIFVRYFPSIGRVGVSDLNGPSPTPLPNYNKLLLNNQPRREGARELFIYYLIYLVGSFASDQEINSLGRISREGGRQYLYLGLHSVGLRRP